MIVLPDVRVMTIELPVNYAIDAQAIIDNRLTGDDEAPTRRFPPGSRCRCARFERRYYYDPDRTRAPLGPAFAYRLVATLNVATVIIAEAGLSFLGVGIPQDSISWGIMISQGRDVISIAWWLVTVPGIAIIIVSLVVNVFGDWLRDFLDPTLRNTE